MPICGIEILYPLEEFAAYKKDVPTLQWSTPVDEETGEYIYKDSRTDFKKRYQFKSITHTSWYKHYRLMIKEVQRWHVGECEDLRKVTLFQLKIVGSMHLNHYGYNYGRFTFDELVSEVKELCSALKLKPARAKIQNIETGVNLALEDVGTKSVFQNLLTCLNAPLLYYEDPRIGLKFRFTEYEFKIYDKGYQSKINENILRIELHFNKMRKINKHGIYTMQDLFDKQKVFSLLALIIKTWAQVLFFDTDLLTNTTLNEKEKNFLMMSQYRDYWTKARENYSRVYLKKLRDMLKKLIQKNGKDYHTEIKSMIETTWKDLFS